MEIDLNEFKIPFYKRKICQVCHKVFFKSSGSRVICHQCHYRSVKND